MRIIDNIDYKTSSELAVVSKFRAQPYFDAFLLATGFFESVERSGETQTAVLAAEKTLRKAVLRTGAADGAAIAAEWREAPDKFVAATQLVDAVASGNERTRCAHMRGAAVRALLLLRLTGL